MRVLVLTHQAFDPVEDPTTLAPADRATFQTEYDVYTTLRALGHELSVLGAVEEIAMIRSALLHWSPHLVFNLLEEFRGEGVYVPYLLGYLQLMRQSFTGCNPSGLLVADDKALTKKILRYHRVPTPDFAIIPRGRKAHRPRALDFPLIVKSATEHGSVGIAHASIVTSDEKLRERVSFVHDHLETDAMIEAYIEGRELYMGVLGNRRLQTLPAWEMVFENLPDGAPRIATERVKWNPGYQARRGITTRAADGLSEAVRRRMPHLCKRVYRILGLTGYARMDFRLTDDGRLYLLEPNPNPDLAREEDFAVSAAAAGWSYADLLTRILRLGRRPVHR